MNWKIITSPAVTEGVSVSILWYITPSVKQLALTFHDTVQNYDSDLAGA